VRIRRSTPTLPSAILTAHAAWLVCAAMTSARARAHRQPGAGQGDTATIRGKLITVPTRISTSARRGHLHLPTGWPWHAAWTQLYDALHAPAAAVT
jgi:hypothetical protein